MSLSATIPHRPHSRARRAGAALTALLAVVGYGVALHVTGGGGPARCVVRADGDGGRIYELAPEQAANAATITAVASRRGLPERAVTTALATAMQESGLRNIGYGDRDSLGLFQQRPSQGWGNTRQIRDPVYSTGKFFDRLVKIHGYTELPVTVAAQRVQRSGYPEAYAQHEAEAALLTSALTGRRAAAFQCTAGPGGADGRAGSAGRVRERLVRDFGPEILAGGTTARTGAAGGGAGRRPAARPDVVVPAGSDRRAWEIAHWAVAHAADLRVSRVSCHGRTWHARGFDGGWHTDRGGAAARDGVVIRPAAGG